MDSPALWLSASFIAAKLTLALWFAQLALTVLDRRRATLSWQTALAMLTIVASWWAARAAGVPSWWRPAWGISSLLAAAALVDGVRRWLVVTSPAEQEKRTDRPRKFQPPPRSSQRVHTGIAAVGLLLTGAAAALGVIAQLPEEALARLGAVLELLASGGLLGVVMAASLELTIGATGPTLLDLNWRGLARWSSLALVVQLATSTLIIAFPPNGESVADSLTPIFFALGMVVVGYIVWAIPRQLVSLAAKKRVEGQASLAVAAWLAAICLAVAAGLPAAWPWAR